MPLLADIGIKKVEVKTDDYVSDKAVNIIEDRGVFPYESILSKLISYWEESTKKYKDEVDLSPLHSILDDIIKKVKAAYNQANEDVEKKREKMKKEADALLLRNIQPYTKKRDESIMNAKKKFDDIIKTAKDIEEKEIADAINIYHTSTVDISKKHNDSVEAIEKVCIERKNQIKDIFKKTRKKIDEPMVEAIKGKKHWRSKGW